MTRSTLARRYAPLVALAVLQLLIIGFVPSKAGKAGGQAVATSGAGAKVGTVDKFQGQEEAVVIYSMTTSSPEDALTRFLSGPCRIDSSANRFVGLSSTIRMLICDSDSMVLGNRLASRRR